VTFNDEAITRIATAYTREAGVRDLERQIGAVIRGIAAKVAGGQREPITVGPEQLREYLGPERFLYETALRTAVPGVATGLAFTPTGGEILFIEVARMPGRGQLTLTGQLGEVMKESAQAAFSYVKAHYQKLGIPLEAFRYWDVHVHIPAGSVPKDGPSAGVTLLSALVSIYTQRRIKHTLAMTGEITLRGLVLPVGGIKEKVLAAKRAGIKKVLLPEKNKKDIEEIDGDVLKGLKIGYVKRMNEVLEEVLLTDADADVRELFKVPEDEKRSAESVNGHDSIVKESTIVN
jgi:ATP-dependent Lon protease